jgi:hypothetical protein
MWGKIGGPARACGPSPRVLRTLRFVQTIDLSERELTAFHEAGHGVAAVRRRGTFDAISIEPTIGRDGFIRTRGVDPCDDPFVIFAGPWAEVRAEWDGLPLDGVDRNGLTFMDYLTTSMRVNANDLREYVPDRDLPSELLYADLGCSDEEAPEIPLARDQSWYGELESCWPTIQWLADMVLNVLRPGDPVDRLVGEVARRLAWA